MHNKYSRASRPSAAWLRVPPPPALTRYFDVEMLEKTILSSLDAEHLARIEKRFAYALNAKAQSPQSLRREWVVFLH
jgi:hypothetical protein